MTMEEVLQFLSENATVHIATVNGDGKPRVRPFTMLAQSHGKLYFATQRNKEVYKELTENSDMELSVASPTAHWLRIRGKAVFISEKNDKDALVEESDIIERFYISHKNEPIEIFYIDEAECVMSNLSDKIVKKFKL